MISFFVRMNELIFKLNDTLSTTSLFHQMIEDIHFVFGIFIVAVYSFNNFDCIYFLILNIEALENSSKWTIT